MNLQACIGNRRLHDAGHTRPPQKAAAAAAIPCQYIQEKSQITEKERILREDKIWTDSWMTHVEKTLLETLIFKCVYFDTMTDSTAKKREQRIEILYFQYFERESVQKPIIYWKEISVLCILLRSSMNLMIRLPRFLCICDYFCFAGIVVETICTLSIVEEIFVILLCKCVHFPYNFFTFFSFCSQSSFCNRVMISCGVDELYFCKESLRNS